MPYSQYFAKDSDILTFDLQCFSLVRGGPRELWHPFELHLQLEELGIHVLRSLFKGLHKHRLRHAQLSYHCGTILSSGLQIHVIIFIDFMLPILPEAAHSDSTYHYEFDL